MNMKLGGYKGKPIITTETWNQFCKMAQLDPRRINRRIRDDYKVLGFDPSYDVMSRSGRSENHCAIITVQVFPLRVLVRWERQWVDDTAHLENLLGDFSM